MNEKGKLDYLGPIVILSTILAVFGDFAFIFAIGALIPVIGLVILFGVLAMHYFTGIMLGFLIVPKLQHLISKIALVLAILLPLPTLLLGLFLAIILQNKFISELATQAAILGIGALTGGAGAVVGEAAETGAAAAEVTAAGAEMAAAGTETVAAGAEAGAATGGRVAAGAEEAGGTTEEAIGRRGPEAETQEKEIPPEALGEEETPFEKLQGLTEKTPDDSTRKENEDDEDIELDDDTNEVNLKKAA